MAGVPLRAAFKKGHASLSATGITAAADVYAETGAVRIADTSVSAIQAQAHLRLTAQNDATGALYAESGKLRLEELAPAPTLAATAPVVLTLTETETPLVRLRPLKEGEGLRAEVQAVFADPALSLRRGSGPDARTMSATFSRLGLEADISLPKGETPTLETAALTGISGTADGGRYPPY